jgi:predicted MFS family arabinose efflux permease
MTTLERPLAPGATASLVIGLSVGLVIAWGTTFNVPAALWRDMARDLAVAKEWIFAGPSVMLIIAALLSPRLGRGMDARGARLYLVGGSIAGAIGLVLAALAPNIVVFLIAWAIFGAAMALGYTNAVFVAVAQTTGERARRIMGLVTVISAASASVSWPASAFLGEAIGWRGTLLVFALANILVALPIHLAVVPRGRGVASRPPPESPMFARRLPDARWRDAAVLLALATGLQGSVSWGLYLHFITVFEGLGHTALSALFLASLIGPASMAARLLEVSFAGKYSAVAVGVAAIAAMVGSLVLFVLAGGSFWGGVVVALLYGGSTGVAALSRATIPLELFGPERYGTILGRLSLPQNLAYAASPVVLAALMTWGGPNLLLGFAIAAALGSLAALLALWRLTREAR